MDCRTITETFHLKEQDPAQLSPLTLAYVGDSVYELAIRTYVTEQANAPVDKLNRKGTMYAKARTQCLVMHGLEPMLTDKELAIYRRGRNAKSQSVAKNASPVEYRTATGFEALIGFLYLSGNTDRLMEVLAETFRLANEQTEG